jgi:hypothetical protein
MHNLEIIKEKEEGRWITNGTHLQGHINVTYSQLVDALGYPLYGPEDSGDGKVQFEWVFKCNGEVFTLYDWKTYDTEYTINELNRWNVGGKTNAGNFIDSLIQLIESKNA